MVNNAPKIYLGNTQDNSGVVVLPWNENNGILIAGRPGSGKTQTASVLLTQLAYQGVQLIPCDYDSPDGEEETLSERIDHLAGCFFPPPAKTAQDINTRLDQLDQEYELRKTDVTRRFPLMIVIDEVSAYLSYLKEIDDTAAIESFTRRLLLFRKVNIRAMIIGQEWSSGFGTTAMRYIRSAFRVKLVHSLDGPNSKMILDFADTNTMRLIGLLETGTCFWDDLIINVPELTETAKEKARAKIATFNHGLPHQKAVEVQETFTPDEIAYNQTWLDEMFLRYGQSAGYNLDIKNKRVLVDFWLSKGYSTHEVVTYLVKGNAKELLTLCQEKRKNAKTGSDI